MLLDFLCPDCGQRYRAPRGEAGRKFDCRACGWPMVVPGRGRLDRSPPGAGIYASRAAEREAVEAT